MANTDHIILSKLRSGDQKEVNEASAILYAEHFPMVRHLVNSNNGTDADAKDIFQEIQISFLKKVRDSQFALKCKLNTFLYAMAKNLWLKELRKRHRNDSLATLKEDVIEAQHNMLGKLINLERARMAREMVDRLDQDCKKVLSLFYYQRWDMASIAREMNYASVQVAKNKKCQCFKKLQKLVVENEHQKR
ncbi:MAG: sigma-70 family RNA polymerase sigma factor [Bacteroidota bacterium]